MEDDGLKATEIYSEKNIVQAFHSQPADQEALKQKNDSIYQWQWDPLINGWQIVSKYVNIVYDTNNNLIIALSFIVIGGLSLFLVLFHLSHARQIDSNFYSHPTPNKLSNN